MAPESGTVLPGGKSSAEVVWAPQAGHKPTDKLILSVIGGADVDLFVEGKVEEARCAFSLVAAAAAPAMVATGAGGQGGAGAGGLGNTRTGVSGG